MSRPRPSQAGSLWAMTHMNGACVPTHVPVVMILVCMSGESGRKGAQHTAHGRSVCSFDLQSWACFEKWCETNAKARCMLHYRVQVDEVSVCTGCQDWNRFHSRHSFASHLFDSLLMLSGELCTSILYLSGIQEKRVLLFWDSDCLNRFWGVFNGQSHFTIP